MCYWTSSIIRGFNKWQQHDWMANKFNKSARTFFSYFLTNSCCTRNCRSVCFFCFAHNMLSCKWNWNIFVFSTFCWKYPFLTCWWRTQFKTLVLASPKFRLISLRPKWDIGCLISCLYLKLLKTGLWRSALRSICLKGRIIDWKSDFLIWWIRSKNLVIQIWFDFLHRLKCVEGILRAALCNASVSQSVHLCMLFVNCDEARKTCGNNFGASGNAECFILQLRARSRTPFWTSFLLLNCLSSQGYIEVKHYSFFSFKPHSSLPLKIHLSKLHATEFSRLYQTFVQCKVFSVVTFRENVVSFLSLLVKKLQFFVKRCALWRGLNTSG